MKTICYTVLFVLLAVLMSDCKKYAEDDRRYLKTPCGRVARQWQLYSITDRYGREYRDSVIYYGTPSNNWIESPEQSFTYNGMIIELDRSDNRLCLETGIMGDLRVLNRPFSSGYYEIRHKRKNIILDIRPEEKTPSRYFIGDYEIYKMTDTELIFGRGELRASFKAVD